ncbi:propionyl-CoA synthetase [Prosthecochloris sp. N3]|uniref:Propionyl-CoA synthetase n=1 Tax=Prosthecochloris ethylica TaxID=2743976 RepID=A0ABR9XSF9_9CHLB|nr:propionyl-CoA synthetase [Prosthecochloris ethylica]MBF0586712.1 propionyl-CoA synthetase [Prosthecochloris ethylica]MBF0636934.1 propionyl-CoA synthetase [Prosthecochloris ethylica]NUK47805.1 propionyl-CoA synthetase [Prosthecochloris ethylica]
MSLSYEKLYRQSIDHPEEFWANAAAQLHWYKPWDKVLDSSNPPFYRWFAGGKTNTCYNALDRHVDEGRGNDTAVIYDSPVTGAKERFTYREFRDHVALFAGALQSRGLRKGDRVIIYMPMIPEALIAMLACARIGAVHSVVFGGFASHELAVRIDDCKPKIIISASCGIERDKVIDYKKLLDTGIELAHFKPEICIIRQRPQHKAELNEERDLTWKQALLGSEPAPCVPLESSDPLYILYTSGTTGRPKGVVRDNGGHMVALQWSMQHVYGVKPGETYWAASDVGWVVGHSYIVYGPLLNGNATIIFEGKPVGTPDPGVFWRIIEEYGVSVFFTAPTAFRAIKKEDPKGHYIRKYDLSAFRALFLAGERADPDTVKWAEQHLDVPVIDHWWQTETGWAIAANCQGIEPGPVKYGSASRAVPGYNVKVVNHDNEELDNGQMGDIVIRHPLPPGTMMTLWKADNHFIESYMSAYPGYYQTSDAGYIDEDGYIFIMSRTDDIINVAGHRLSTGAIEAELSAHPDVAESAVIGVADDLKGEVPVGFLVLKSGVDTPPGQIIRHVVEYVRENIGPVAAFKLAVIVNRLPKTRSGKILRRTMRQIANGDDYTVPATIDDPDILEEIKTALQSIGYAQ